MTLYHFTCDHGFDGIKRARLVYPNPHLLLTELSPLVWFTDEPEPERDSVGLTSSMLTCDRMAYRFRVTDARACKRWLDVREAVRPSALRDLESFGRPETWWVASVPVPVRYDPIGARVAGVICVSPGESR